MPSDVRSYLNGAHPFSFPPHTARTLLERRLAVAVAIDHLLGDVQGHAHPRVVPRGLPSGMATIRDHWLGSASGSYLKHGRGLLIAKRARSVPGLPEAADTTAEWAPPPIRSGSRLDALFQHVLRITWPEGGSFELDFGRIPRRDDPGSALEPDGAPTPPIRICVVPWAERPEALHFSAVGNSAAPRLRTTVTPDAEAAMKDAAAELVARLSADAVQVAVLPELVVTPGVVDALRSALRKWAKRDEATSLRMVVAGSGLSSQPAPGSDLRYNECVILGATGKTLWTQSKLHPYAMDTGTMRRYGLGECVLENGTRHREDIHAHNVIRVRDGSLGRMLVLICEDLAQQEPGRTVMDLLRPDWLFVPVLDGQLATGRWIHQHAWPIGSQFATNTVVATSMVLPLRADPGLAEVAVGLCVLGANPRLHRLLRVRCCDARPLLATVDWPGDERAPDGWVEVTMVGATA